MAKKTSKEISKKKVVAKSITKKMVETLINKRFDEVDGRIDRILAAMAKNRPLKHL